MKKNSNLEENKDYQRKISIKDIIIIVLSVAVLGALVVVLKYARDLEKEKQKELVDISDNLNTDGTTTHTNALDNLILNEIAEDGRIEFYNKSSKTLDISGITVLVNNNPVFTVPADTTISHTEYYIAETGVTLGEKAGDIVAIADKDGAFVSHIMLPKLEEGNSYGTIQDGSDSRAIMLNSIGNVNAETLVVTASGLVFSVEGGFYTDAFDLTLSAKDCKIYYTTDGTEPTVNSTLYTDTIRITPASGGNITHALSSGYFCPTTLNMGTIVRAIAVDAQGKIVESKSQSYFIGIGSNSEYANMPVISITTNPENLFDYYTGIYVTGRTQEDAIAATGSSEGAANYWMDWKVPAHIEYFEGDKDKTFEGDVQLEIYKQDANVTGGQKAFYISNDTVNISTGCTLSDFYNQSTKKLILQTGEADNSYKLRELLAQRLGGALSVGTANKRLTVVFVDGEYWGAYLMREEYDSNYFKENYDVDDVLVYQNGTYDFWLDDCDEYVEFQQFVLLNDLSKDSNYAKLCSMMDMQSYLDYICSNIYLSNYYLGQDDYVVWRSKKTGGEGYNDGRWRWCQGKLQITMNNGMRGNVSTGSIDTFLIQAIASDPLFQALLANKTFCRKLEENMNRMAKEIYSEENVAKALEEVSSAISRAAMSSYKRFSGSVADTFYDSEVSKISEFFTERPNYILGYTQEVIDAGSNKEIITNEKYKWCEFYLAAKESGAIKNIPSGFTAAIKEYQEYLKSQEEQ